MPARGWQRLEIALLTLVGLERLELSTSRLSGVRSNHLSYRPVSAWSFLFRPRQARRCLGHLCLDRLPASTPRLPCRNKKSRRGKPLPATKRSSPHPPRAFSRRPLPPTKTGGAGRDRTDDLRLAKPMLSRLSYSPKQSLVSQRAHVAH